MRAYSPPAHEGLTILYKDESYLVLDKPSGLLSVPGRAEENKDSLATRVQTEYPNATIVHRLDMDTSGIMVMALSKEAHRDISRQFEHKETDKSYTAIVWGLIEGKEGSVDLPMRCDWPNRPKQIVDHEQGKFALTHWKCLAHDEVNNTSRIALFPVTGRSHQLRVHMQALGHPILGDPFYAKGDAFEASSRLLLHATELNFTHHKSDDRIKIKSNVPF
ncbi:RluA family pseudouridine synthase [Curvivirga aplysinae]|uniref:RluA family pseudouridine synthase n=1 Tax=Curvivirga aplysinae TaxID=2529852 RepID=UPI0012BC5250|nr:RluA family pseudouridine synthase [Curvivirga aplysinae]MTI10559.1 RluA family pseudouridine synthase [Curvivirga aplysinae]